MSNKAFRAEEVSLLVRSYYDVQKVRIEHLLRVKTLSRGGETDTEAEAEQHYGLGVEELQAAERVLKNRIDQATRDHPVRAGWMGRVRGIGPVLAGGVIAQIERREQVLATLAPGHPPVWITAPELYPNDGVRKERYAELGVTEVLKERRSGIACFETVSSLWAFAGLAVIGGEAQRRKKGERSNWSSVFKVLAWKIGESFVKQGGSFREEYDRYKLRMRLAHPEAEPVPGTKRQRWTDLHIHNAAKRYAAKMFLAMTYIFWRELKGLPCRAPYAIEALGHTTSKSWRDYLDRTEEEVKARRRRKTEEEDGEASAA